MSAPSTAPTEFCDYNYTGPVQSVALKAKDTEGKLTVFFEGTFHPGKTYTLPCNHPTVQAWVCGQILTQKEATHG
ncbi:hypothetical protein [Pseudovibrio sp. Tun.PSC04-5.I4]|uniref:hypothetical protein n=1 Tax=Pseudovibrio sp. Tun.PSC04-5.I4 TaxID=1798213 RepID=UPI000890C910|nr:hypothetical protein [Pseudovibrio sp. Tun.PSC04-5.I4]SDQ17393.1 hypothetical protein SAMN04515695_0320 [Pseudovibrio sp. Tun.PSC04-5.I4]